MAEQPVATENAKVIWQDNSGQAILIEGHDDLICLKQENDIINIDRVSLKEFIKAIKSV